LIGVVLLFALTAFAEVLDRIAVVIDDSFIITLSDIRKERLIQAALGTDAGTDDAITDALIERHLVEDQISQYREIEIPSDAIAERLRTLGTPRGVSSDDLREAVIGEFRRREFMIERFQQFIRVSDDELQKYYDEVFTPAVRSRGERLPPLQEVSEAIRQNKIAEKMNEEIDVWLSELKGRSLIEKIPN
jgi:hypothetical protein